ncbi:hypothetical protein [Pseudomonas boanensis]|uniref:hypothetical protein n=1 Tax=Metapseudomonas boanensis TaxID=2822138 RepID=UPI0035D4B782
MNPRYREIHKTEIKRQLARDIDRKWDGLYGAFTAGIVLLCFGIAFFLSPQPGSIIWGSIFVLLGGSFLAVYRWLLRFMRTRGIAGEWLTLRDQWIVAAMIALSVWLSSHTWMWLLAFLSSAVYGTWRLRQQLRPYWKRYYFGVARNYLRDISRYGPRRKGPGGEQGQR